MAWLKVSEALAGEPGTELTVKGWVRTRRDSKADGGLSFVQVHDGTCFDPIQVVARGELANYAEEVAKLTTGCAIEVDGKLVASQGKGQSVEIEASEIRVIGWVEDPDTYPVPQKRHTFEYLREVAHLRTRTNTFSAMARVRHRLAMGIHRFFDDRGYYWVHTPIVTASDAEGAGQMFRVSTLDQMNLPMKKIEPPPADDKAPKQEVDYAQDFFGRPSFLTVSGQLEVETFCCALSRVYTFGPTFRAENSNTARHLAEFWMVEPEIAFGDIHDNAKLAEEMLKFLLDDLLTARADDMAFFDLRIEKGLIERLRHIIDSPFRVLSYTDAIDILSKAKSSFEYEVKWGNDLQTEHERYLTEEHFKQPVTIIDWPKEIKAFYMRLNDNNKTVAGMDVLVPRIGEIIGGSQREERLDVLDARIIETGLEPEAYWWYRDLRKYGTVPHAGFGLGFERLILLATGMQNIRDVIPFPRAPKQCEF